MVTWAVSAIPADSETRIERKAGLRCSPCLIQLTDKRQGGREIEMRHGIIAVGLKAAAQPNTRFGVGALPKFGEADKQTPDIDACIAGRETERLLYMGFSFPAPTEKKLRSPDVRVRAGQIPIQRQRPLAFGDALSRAVRKRLHKAQDEMSQGMVRCQGQRLCDGRLGGSETFYPIVAQKVGDNRKIDPRCAYQRLNISRFECQGPFIEAARLCHVFGCSAHV